MRKCGECNKAIFPFDEDAGTYKESFCSERCEQLMSDRIDMYGTAYAIGESRLYLEKGKTISKLQQDLDEQRDLYIYLCDKYDRLKCKYSKLEFKYSNMNFWDRLKIFNKESEMSYCIDCNEENCKNCVHKDVEVKEEVEESPMCVDCNEENCVDCSSKFSSYFVVKK